MTAPKLIKVIVLTTLVIGVALILSAVLLLPGAVTVIGSTPSTMTRSSPSGDPDTILRATR